MGISYELKYFDFYDWDALEKLQTTRNKKLMKLWMKARTGDEKARKALQKHEEVDRYIKENASKSGFYWV